MKRDLYASLNVVKLRVFSLTRQKVLFWLKLHIFFNALSDSADFPRTD